MTKVWPKNTEESGTMENNIFAFNIVAGRLTARNKVSVKGVPIKSAKKTRAHRSRLALVAGVVALSSLSLSCSPSGGSGSAATGTGGGGTGTTSCPTGYVLVPKNLTYTSADFCVSKYIASQSGAIALSVSGAAPWVSINRANAITACQANGAGYDLITNAEWQTIARNIELVSSNWSGGTIGSAGGLNAGINDGSQSSGMAAGNDDTNGCFNTGQACPGSTWNSQKRTFNLSNGNVVWDMAGNVYQWVKDDSSLAFGADGYFSQITAASNPVTHTVGGITGNAKTLFGPSGNYTARNTTPFAGLGYGWINYTAGAVLRGGYWLDGVNAGVFRVFLSLGPSLVSTAVGFRCVFHP